MSNIKISWDYLKSLEESLESPLLNRYQKQNNYNLKKKKFIKNLGKVVYQKYKNEFCSSFKNSWYHYKDGFWYELENNNLLINKISSEIVQDYYNFSSYICKEKNYMKLQKINETIIFLENIDENSKFLDICFGLFYIHKFEEYLDQNEYIIGFENGMFNLKNREFNKSEYDDYLKLSTHQYYNHFIPKETIEKFDNFIKQLLPDKNIRNYFLSLLSVYLTGINYGYLHIFVNIDQRIIHLLKHVFGDYSVCLPKEIISLNLGDNTYINKYSKNIIETKGKRIGFIYENNEFKFNNRTFLYLRDGISGSSNIIDKKYEFESQLNIIIHSDNKLKIDVDGDNYNYRRLYRKTRVVEFNNISPNLFRELDQNMVQWSNYLIYLLINKNKSYLVNSIDKPPNIINSITKTYLSKNSFINI